MFDAICNACHQDIIERFTKQHLEVCPKTYCLLCQMEFKPTDVLAANGFVHFACMNNINAFSDKTMTIKTDRKDFKDGDIIGVNEV